MRVFLRSKAIIVTIMLLSAVVLFSNRAVASHAVGIDLTYQCLGGNQYEFTVNFYRDCDGVSAPSSAFISISSASCGISTSTSLSRVSTIEVSAICPGQLGSSSCSGGSLPGIQQYTYRGNFTLPANCNDWVISYNLCCRNSAITNLQSPGSQSLYVDANLNNAGGLCNNSPFFTSLPTPYLCAGQPFFYNHGAIDIDGDSLVYTLVDPRTSATGNIPHRGGFSASNPLSTTTGFTFNTATGQMGFTPTNPQQAVVTVRVDEYRNGVLIGSVIRDLQLVVINCNNQLPTASGINGTSGVGGAYDISVCAGFPLCFDISSNDQNAGQQVSMQWNGGVQGATFTATGTPFPRATFCWTPGPSDIGSHSFSLEVRDNACPIPGLNIYTYTINVTPNPNPPVSAGPDLRICQGGSTPLTATTAATGVTYTWTPSSGLSCTNCASPTASPGITTVYTVTANYPDGCSGSDDVKVTVNPTPTVSVFPASATICSGGSITLSATGSAAATSYTWNPGNLSGPSILVSPTATTTYTVTAFDATGCPSLPATSVVTLNPPPAAPVCNNIYVTTTGSGTGLSQSSPTTLANALVLGACNSVNIKMAIGTYQIDNAITNFTSYMTIEGGFDPANGWRKTSLPGATTILRSNANPDGPLTAPRIVAFYINTAQYFRFQDLTIQTQDAPIGNVSNYVMHLTACSNYEIVRTRLICGKGGDGISGLPGATGANGSNGANGTNGDGDDQNRPGLGGIGGIGAGAGAGASGLGANNPNGCCQNGLAGTAGNASTDPRAGGGGGGGGAGGEEGRSGGTGGGGGGVNGGAGVAGGAGGGAENDGANGAAGTAGTNGAAGAAGSPSGFGGGFFIPGGFGGDGANGTGGRGGGGGGGGGGQGGTFVIDGAGNGGGGGGGGGQGGTGGTGATSGGASIALYLYNNGAGGNIRDCNVAAGAAGAAGIGGTGGPGGNGGGAGTGGTADLSEIGRGGNGGVGGRGGNGGNGGSAAGGVSLQYRLDGGVSPVTGSYNFNFAAQPVITATNIACTNTNITFESASSGSWNYGSGAAPATGVGASVITQYSTVGRKDITYGANAYLGFANIAISNAAFVPDISVQGATMVNPTTYRICAGTPVTYRTSSLAVAYDWNLQGILPSNYTTQNVTNVLYNTPGTYTVTLRVNTDCCGWSQTTTVTMIVEDNPNLIFSGVTSYCEGDQTVINVRGAATYVWSPSTGLSSNTDSTVTVVAQTTTTYLVYGYNASGTCYDLDSITITVNPEPVLTTSSVAATCGSNGSVSVTVTPTGTYSYAWNTVPVQNTATATNVPQGNYQVVVTNTATGCSSDTYQTVAANGTPIAYITGVADVTCFGLNDGAAQAAVAGGTGPYTYAWSDGPTVSPNRPSLAAGQYTVTVTDVNGCSSTAIAYINEPPLLIAPVSSIPASCSNTLDGTLVVAPDGGAGSYLIAWSTTPQQTTDTVFNVAPGGYTVTVTDANNCTITRNITVSSPPAFVISQTSFVNTTCGGTNGSITINAIGGTGTKTYTLDAGTPQPTGAFTNVPPGAHTILIADANGCDTTYNFTFTTPPPFSLTTTVTPIGCSGGTTGTIVANGVGGTGALQYRLGLGPYSNNNTFTLLPSGTYIVWVRDAVGCTLTDTVTLAAPGSLSVTLVQDSVSCNGASDGVVTATGVGGTSPYRFNISGGGPLSANNVFTGLSAANYTVTVTDDFGCTATATIAVRQPAVVTVALVQDSVDCNGGADGSITATGAGGSAPYQYSIDGGTTYQPSGLFTGLSAGPYTLSVTDAKGCTGSGTITVRQPAGATMNPVVDDLTCPSNPTGAIATNPSGGSPPYQFSINNGTYQTSPNFLNLSIGTYTIILQDARGCFAYDTVTVSAPGGVSVSLNVIGIGCGNTTGSITATASGGTPGTYYYSINGGTLQTSGSFTGLLPGFYTIRAYDSGGCFALDTATIANVPPINLALVTDSVSCFGGSDGQITATANGVTAGYTFNIGGGAYSANNVFSGLTPGPYTIGVQDGGGCTATASVTIYQPAQLGATAVVDSVDCNGGADGEVVFTATGGTAPYEYSLGSGYQPSNTFSGLTATAFPNAVVRDAKGCTFSIPVTVFEPAALLLTLVQDSASCNGAANGQIFATLAGGSGGYEFSIDNGPFVSSGIFSGLSAGQHTVDARDVNLCTTSSTITVIEPAAVTISLASPGIACASGTGQINVTAGGGSPGYEYQLDAGGWVTTSSFTGLSANTYSVTVRDQNGCTATDNIVLTAPAALTVTAVQDSVNCGGASDGEITATGNGGTGALEYSIDGVNFQASTLFTGLGAGPYTVTVQDANSCTATVNIDVLEPTPLTISLAQDSVSCNGLSDGVITVTAGGGSPSYEYSLDGTNFQASNVFSARAAGPYTVTLRDAKSCTITDNITVLEPALLGVSAVAVDVSCNSTNDGSITVTATGGSLPYTFDLNSGTPQSSNVFNGLTATVYTVNVVDDNGCTQSTTATVGSTTGITVSLVADSLSCNGAADGVITVTATSVAGGLEYSTDGTNFQASNIFNSLNAGSYTITVRDANLCVVTASIDVDEPVALTATATQDSVSCGGGADGVITVTAAGGSPNYTYTLGAGTPQASNVFNGLTAANYTVTVDDSKGCQTQVVVDVLEPAALTISLATTPASCAGGTGSITVTAGGGSPNYEYSIDGTTFQTSNSFPGLVAGPYTVTLRDTKGCVVTDNINVAQPAALTLTLVQDSVSCNGLSDGTITVTAGGGNSVYDYSIDGTNFQVSNVLTGLAAGPYTVTLRDGNGCTETASITVLEPAVLTIGTTLTDISCNSTNDGQIDALGAGGSPGYEYSLDNGTFQTSGTFANLTANTYSIDVRDANGCTATTTATVQAAAAVTVTLTQDSVSCNAGADGQIVAVGAGGSGALQYSIDGVNFQPSGTFTGLTAGPYTVEVRDLAGCNTTDNITVLEPTALSVTAVQDSANCFGAADGFITATATGGSPGYEYSSDGTTFAPAAVINNLTAAAYTITVRDGNGCTATANATVLQPTAITTNVTGVNVACNGGADGSATVVAGGGSPGYNYSWNAGGGNGATSSGRTAGWAVVTVSDGNSCQRKDSVQITEPNAIAITETITQITCASGNVGLISLAVTGGTGAYTYLWDNAEITSTISNLAAGTYDVVVTDANGCTQNGSYVIDQPGNVSLTTSVNGVSCFDTPTGSATATVTGATGGVTYTWGTTPPQTTATATGLMPGAYGVTVTDATGCSATGTAVVANAPLLTATSVSADPRCFDTADGSMDVTASGGTGNLVYTWSHSNTLNTASATGLTQGSYSVTVTDANNCTVSVSEALTSPSQLFISLAADADTVKFGESVELTATPGSGVIGTPIYEWTPSDILDCTDCNDPVAGPLVNDNYVFTVRIADDNGCDAEAQVRVVVDVYDRVLWVPNVFTPNGDGLNETFNVYGYGYETMLFQVFDRWGEKMFETTDPKVGWDGTFKGVAMPPGVYVYVVVANYIDGQEGYKKGSVTLLK